MVKEKKSLAQKMGITRTVERPREESDIQLREDRVGKYFRKYINKFVFVEFSDEFLKKSKSGNIMKGVPVPLRKKEVKAFAGGEGVEMLVLAENMAWVMGCDPHFKYTQQYCEFLTKGYGKKMVEGILKKGRDAAEQGEMDQACIMFRACLCMQYDYLHAMYSYARALRVMYMSSRNEEYVGRFKAEALDWLELLTETHPRFAMGFYYLGYAYLNMGLYAKTVATWNSFLKFTKNNKDRKEIKSRIQQISDPVKIEEGCNDIMAGRYVDGINTLELYTKTQYNDWWPLHYYLGVGYQMVGDVKAAVTEFKKVLSMNGSHIETMKELLSIYEAQGDKDNVNKFAKKIELIESAQAEEQAKHMKETAAEDKKLQEEEPKPLEPEYIETDESQRDDEPDSKDASKEPKKTIVKRLGSKK
ncbi:MAG: hypothetical protein Q4C80_07245 [Bacillota bacterium]|nr:hypothetical protein [Bacillota bacterium]